METFLISSHLDQFLSATKANFKISFEIKIAM